MDGRAGTLLFGDGAGAAAGAGPEGAATGAKPDVGIDVEAGEPSAGATALEGDCA